MAQQSGNPQCPFCQLAANPEQTFDVHETEHFKAWLDINPRAKGHTMIVPKEHSTSMDEIGDNASELFEMIRIVMEKAKNGLDADGVSVVLNDGEAAGQRLDHFYAQVFPRFEGEENEGAPAGAVFQPLENLDESDLEEFSQQMENANFTTFNPSKSGPGTAIKNEDIGGFDKREPQKQEQKPSHQQQEQRQQERRTEQKRQERSRPQQEQEEREEESEDDEDEEKEDQSQDDTWDGDSYDWTRDGAEFK